MIAKSNRAHRGFPEQSPIFIGDYSGTRFFANYLITNSLNNHIKFIFKPRLADLVMSNLFIAHHLLFPAT
jgi:hypothetical protein